MGEGEVRTRLGVTLAVAAGLVAGALLEWVPAEPSPWRWLPLGLAYVAGGASIVRDSWRTLRDERRLSIDFLMGAAAAGAALIGSPLEGAILIFLFSLSNTLESFAMGRTRRAIHGLIAMSPKEATLADASGHPADRVPVEALRPGDAILVRPGERIAADGAVLSGHSQVDQSAITGESVPVPRAAGDDVFAGTINGGGALVVRVGREAGETMLATIIRLVEEAREQRAPAQQFIDRFAHPYTLAVVVVTALVATLPPLLAGTPWTDAFYRAMTLLVVASPCALVISTPAAILSGIANGARHGVLFKGGAFLDLAGSIDTVAFDKTGTLTIGRPVLLGMRTAADDEPSRRRLLRLAAAVERNSEHHLARAVLDAAAAKGLDVPSGNAFQATPGEGVQGVVEGLPVWVGNGAMAARFGALPPADTEAWVAAEASAGRSVVLAGAGPELLGALSFGDTLKDGAEAAIRSLKADGVRRIVILSGDHPAAAAAVASGLGADEVRAGLLPHQKVEAVRGMLREGSAVAMVGDGVNDAPAMAAATVGIAMGAMGTDVAIETADIVLMSDDVRRVDYALRLGRRTRRVVRQNVWFSIGWMILLVGAALTVGIPLTLAVIAHEGSTLLVALNGLRLLAGGPGEGAGGAARWGGGGRRPPAAAEETAGRFSLAGRGSP
jgi:Zn2+/Cd2+-exporting ATPase